MTVAIIDRSNWLGGDKSRIDKTKVLKTLNDYIVFLKTVLSS
jgi:hypothetical protein